MHPVIVEASGAGEIVVDVEVIVWAVLGGGAGLLRIMLGARAKKRTWLVAASMPPAVLAGWLVAQLAAPYPQSLGGVRLSAALAALMGAGAFLLAEHILRECLPRAAAPPRRLQPVRHRRSTPSERKATSTYAPASRGTVSRAPANRSKAPGRGASHLRVVPFPEGQSPPIPPASGGELGSPKKSNRSPG